MHTWGDEWFEQYGGDLNAAISYIENYLHKHHIGVCGKEKYGTYRDEYLRFWNGGIYQILFGYRVYIGTYKRYPWQWLENFVNKIHNFIYFKIDLGVVDKKDNETTEEYFERCKKHWWKGLCYINTKLGLLDFVHKRQAKYYNYAFQKACKKWPHLVDELICMVDGYKMIKPCKYGDIDGEEINKKYWVKIDDIK